MLPHNGMSLASDAAVDGGLFIGPHCDEMRLLLVPLLLFRLEVVNSDVGRAARCAKNYETIFGILVRAVKLFAWPADGCNKMPPPLSQQQRRQPSLREFSAPSTHTLFAALVGARTATTTTDRRSSSNNNNAALY